MVVEFEGLVVAVADTDAAGVEGDGVEGGPVGREDVEGDVEGGFCGDAERAGLGELGDGDRLIGGVAGEGEVGVCEDVSEGEDDGDEGGGGLRGGGEPVVVAADGEGDVEFEGVLAGLGANDVILLEGSGGDDGEGEVVGGGGGEFREVPDAAPFFIVD